MAVSVKEHIELIINGDAHDHPCDDCSASELHLDVPPWFDEKKFVRGQEYIRRNILAQNAATLAGLVCGLALPSFLTIMINSNKSSTVLGAYRRYVSTNLHINSWFSKSLRPGSEAWKSLSTIRLRHLRASKAATLQHKGHISQRDLTMAQFGFVGIGLLRADMLGMGRDPKDVEGYVHFWRTIGFMLGIEDRYNMCRESVDETIEVASAFRNILIQLVSDPPEYFYHMASVMLKGFWYVSPVITEKVTIFFAFRLLGVPGYYYREEEKLAIEANKTNLLNFKDSRLINELKEARPKLGENILRKEDFTKKFTLGNRISLFVLVFLHETLLKIGVLRWYFNLRVAMSYFFVKYFPYMIMFKYGWRESFVDMYKTDKSYPSKLVPNAEMLAVLQN